MGWGDASLHGQTTRRGKWAILDSHECSREGLASGAELSREKTSRFSKETCCNNLMINMLREPERMLGP